MTPKKPLRAVRVVSRHSSGASPLAIVLVVRSLRHFRRRGPPVVHGECRLHELVKVPGRSPVAWSIRYLCTLSRKPVASWQPEEFSHPTGTAAESTSGGVVASTCGPSRRSARSWYVGAWPTASCAQATWRFSPGALSKLCWRPLGWPSESGLFGSHMFQHAHSAGLSFIAGASAVAVRVGCCSCGCCRRRQAVSSCIRWVVASPTQVCGPKRPELGFDMYCGKRSGTSCQVCRARFATRRRRVGGSLRLGRAWPQGAKTMFVEGLIPSVTCGATGLCPGHLKTVRSPSGCRTRV